MAKTAAAFDCANYGMEDRICESALVFHIPPDSANGLEKESGFDAFQIKSVSEERFERRLGFVSSDQLKQVVKAVALCIGFPTS
jgi:mRNA-degrading endonuclease toxin of MazEF toxin-antitoxin module